MLLLLFKLYESKSNNFLSNHQMIFSKIGIQLQITIITIKTEHLYIENMKFILYSKACLGKSKMYAYFYCNCNYCNALHFAISGLHFEKIKSFCDRGFHLWHFYAFTNWLSTNYTGWNPSKRVSPLLRPSFIHLSIGFQ